MAYKGAEDLCEVLYTREEIAVRVKEIGKQITEDYKGKELLLVGVLRGAIAFFADLMREIDLDVKLDFIAASSYGSGTKTSGEVRITKDLNSSIEGKHVIIVEDMLDTGLTLKYLTGVFAARNPASMKLCVFMDKPERRIADIHADYVGFEVPDKFVVGYGLDYNQHYRALPDVGVLKSELYTK